MSDKRSLFAALFWRVMIVLTAALAVMIMFAHMYQLRHFNELWRADLQQEAVWTARHFVLNAPERDVAPGGARSSHDLGAAWRSMHESVRLVVRDAGGEVVIDSHPGTPAPSREDHRGIVGMATVQNEGGDWDLILSRPSPAPYPLSASWVLLLAALALIVLTAALIYPLTRRMAKALQAVATETDRMASGAFGAPIEPRGVRELDQLVAAFNTMSQKLQAEQARRQRLIGDVSHELRSPLGRVRAIGETIVRHPNEARALVAQSEAELALLERLISDLLDTARLEHGGDVLERESVDLSAWWGASMDRFKMGAARDGVALNAQTPSANISADIDAQRLFQALANIVDNAVTACAGRDDSAITATLQVDPARWSIAIADNGRGIPAASLPLVFDRFYRVEQDRGRKTGGVGLGLSIAKAIVEAHGGVIAIESAEAAGATVRLTFPRS
jgi:signal transduction histidine kinase